MHTSIQFKCFKIDWIDFFYSRDTTVDAKQSNALNEAPLNNSKMVTTQNRKWQIGDVNHIESFMDIVFTIYMYIYIYNWYVYY
jgi:hypothetical protein